MYTFGKFSMDDGTFYALSDEGDMVECEAIVAFESEITGKTYIIYTDNTFDEDESLKVYASTYDYGSEKLGPVETDEEWAIIEKVIEEYQNGELEENE